MRLVNIEEDGFDYVWDIEVDNHEYLLENGIVSHNTSQLLGNRESIEPIYSNYYVRSTGTGEYLMPNKYLDDDIEKLGMDIDEVYEEIRKNDGSLEKLNIPDEIKNKYKTVWEMSQIELAKMSQERMIDQSESHNLFISDPTLTKLHCYHLHSHILGLKTGMYYLKQKAAKAQDFSFNNKNREKPKRKIVCTDEVCTACSS